MKTRCVLLCIILTGVLRGLSGELKYITTVFTPDSILQNKQDYIPMRLGNRWRYATCGGTSWFHDNYLATINLFGEKITIYKFDEQTRNFTVVQQIKNQSTAYLKNPEQLHISPDGTLLAVGNTKGPSIIHIFPIDLQTHRINPIPLVTIPACGFIHSVRFTPNNRYFVHASFDKELSLCIYKVVSDSNGIKMEHLNTYASDFTSLKTKTVYFTQDGNYIIRGYAHSMGDIAHTKDRPYESLLVVHRFHSDGSVGELVSTAKGSFHLEDIALIQNDTAIIVTDQSQDLLYRFSFDSTTGRIGDEYSVVQNTEGQLSFPHGLGISQNGKYLAVTNYGNDSFSVYELS